MVFSSLNWIEKDGEVYLSVGSIISVLDAVKALANEDRQQGIEMAKLNLVRAASLADDKNFKKKIELIEC